MKNSLIRIGFKRFLWAVKFWYGLSMFLTRVRTPVADFIHQNEISIALRHGDGWRDDPLKGALDVMTHPTRVQRRLNEGKKEIEDCDGHAGYWCSALLKNKLATKAWLGFYQMVKEDSSRSGHAICVFEDALGNRFYADYNKPHAITSGSIWEWATASARGYNAIPVAAGMIEVTINSKTDGLKWGKATSKTDFILTS